MHQSQAQTDFAAMQQIQNHNDDMRDEAIAKINHDHDVQVRQENARRNAITKSIIERNKEIAQERASNAHYNNENRDIDLEERKLKLHKDQVRDEHSEEFIKGELERQKAINNEINKGDVPLTVEPVDGQ